MSRFDFKQFSISQSACAMKVGTDGVLLGSWAPADPSRPLKVWDIGCGTGLIGIMMAQRLPLASITAIEIDPVAAEQAYANAQASPWASRIDVLAGDALRCYKELPQPDIIVCNPPFFTNSLASPDGSRSVARHDDTLPLVSLLRLAAGVIAPGGAISLVIPFDRMQYAVAEAEFVALAQDHIVEVSTVETRPPRRALVSLKRVGDTSAGGRIERHYIRDAAGNYSDWYISLTRDFYLHF